jgi:glycosyltransferase involved in cell wall biosynthesis
VPKISIVIPCYNHGHFLKNAIDSVLHSDGETQVIVVNDGSTDSTDEVIESFGQRICSVRQDNLGLSSARNAGIALAQGDLILFLDADDWLEPQTIPAFAKAAERVPDAQIFTGGWKTVDVSGKQLARFPATNFPPDAFHFLLRRNPAPCHTFAVRLSLLQSNDLFDITLKSHEDWDFWLRLASRAALFCSVPEATSAYRMYPGSMSSNRLIMKQTALAVVERWGKLHSSCELCRGTQWRTVHGIHCNSLRQLFEQSFQLASAMRFIDAVRYTVDEVRRDPDFIRSICAAFARVADKGMSLFRRQQ